MTTRIALGSCALALVTVLAASAPTVARAETATAPTDCPPGAVGKAEGSNAWCEPTVCETEAQCTPGQVCRSVPLCVQVGTIEKKDGGPSLAPDKNAGNKLMAVGRCGPDQKCPESTVCNEKKRCVDRAASDKMGPVSAASASPSASAGATSTATPPAKSSCGCDVVGARGTFGGAGALGAVAIVVGVVGVVGRRRARRV